MSSHIKLVQECMSAGQKLSVNADGSNWTSVSYQARMFVRSSFLEKFFRYKKSDETKVSVFNNPMACSNLLELNEEAQKPALIFLPKDDAAETPSKDLKYNNAAFMLLGGMCSKHHSMLLQESLQSPAIGWSKLVSKFGTTGNVGVRHYHGVLNNAKVNQYKDFDAFVSAIEDASLKLANMGQTQNDDRLITTLTQGMVGQGWKTFRTVVENDASSSFAQLVSKVRKMLQNKRQRKTEKQQNLRTVTFVDDDAGSRKKQLKVIRKRFRRNENNRRDFQRSRNWHPSMDRKWQPRTKQYKHQPKFDGRCFICDDYGSRCRHRNDAKRKKARAKIAKLQLDKKQQKGNQQDKNADDGLPTKGEKNPRQDSSSDTDDE